MIKEKLALVPNTPGCYLMKNKDNIIIYVGKAKKLKNRLSSYFRGTHTGKTAKLVSEIVDFEYILVSTEAESLILELNLIKKYDPKYNILLKDDKSYPYIELTNESVPRLLVVRNINQKKKNRARMYGPYPNVTAARNIVNLLNRLYPLRKCKNYEKKECLYYHIGECLGYCTKKVDPLAIKNIEGEIIRFLNGDHSIVTEKLLGEMNAASANLNFEKALELKQLYEYVQVVLLRENVEVKDNVNRDVFGYAVHKGYISIEVLFLRGGKIIGHHNHIFPIVDEVSEEVNRYIAYFYNADLLVPNEILVPNICDTELLSNFLNVKVVCPVKGAKNNLIKMATNNASNHINEKFELIIRDEKRTVGANETLRELLKLDKLNRIELFDNSHLFGTFAVSGMVVFKEGKVSKKDYRKFKVSVDTNDDYGTMREVAYRRYYRMLVENTERPDLIIADGGIGQVNAIKEIIDSLNLSIKVIGLKKDDHHSTEALIDGDNLMEIKIDKQSDLFHYLERMQDEIHRFTITYHKQIRSKGALESILDNVPGIGVKRRDMLLKKYRSINNLKNADISELKEIIPLDIAHGLIEYLNSIN